MPTYDYRCRKCGARFTRSQSISENESAKPSCPKCRSKRVAWLPARFVAVTSKKS